MTAAYTPLESLLLFTHLRAQGADHAAFRTISQLLIDNPTVSADPRFDSGRLSADALSDFYLRLLKEEVKSDLERAVAAAQPDLHNGSKKRKAASPSLPTVQEASQHVHLIPQLVTKLYARYRSHQLREIREQERRYELLQREVREIEQGQWDERLQREVQKGQWDALLSRAGQQNGLRNGAPAAEEPAAKAQGGNAQASAQGPPGKPDATVKPVSQGAVLPADEQPAQKAPRLSPSPRPGEAKSPVPRTTAMPPPSSTQRLAPQPPPGPPLQAAPPYGSSPGPAPWPPAGPYQPPTPRQQQSPHAGPANVPYSPYSKGASPLASPSPGPTGHPSSHPPPVSAFNKPPQPPSSHRPPRVGGIELPPFQINSPPVTKPPFQQPAPPPGFSPVPPPGQNAQPYVRQADGRMVPLPPRSMLDGILKNLSKNRKQSYGHKTKWKTPVGPSLPSVELPLPERESLSPPPPKPASKAVMGQQTKKQPTPSVENDSDSRRPVGRTRRTRGGSVASSAVASSMRGRTRSQSVTSHMSLDNDSVSGRRVKPEPSTPAGTDEDVTVTIEASPGGPTQRGRRSAAQHLPLSRKRRRSLHDTSEPSESSQEPLPPPAAPATHVLVPRNFARICNPVLNDILSHKHASLFSNPVKERDAPGYSELVLRPQDFKSIKAAISQGSKSVAAMLSDALPAQGTPSSAAAAASGHVRLPVSADLLPPKAIVNPSQLEKEITRVFANAAMYNVGDDDPVVQDAREMFESVRKSLSDWRSVERAAEPGSVPVLTLPASGAARGREVEDSEDEVAPPPPPPPPAASEGGTAAGKRRKVG
ncbi:MAG: hypothetical protein INR71_01615 [Terriglobus roseus]|nr:hypothetical protein [Terriglobus roseus]